MLFGLSLCLVERLSLLAISIVNSENTVFPCSFHDAFPLAQEHVLLLERLVTLKQVTDFRNFFAGFGRVSQWRALRLFTVELAPCRVKHFNIDRCRLLVFLSVALELQGAVTFFKCRYILSFLKPARSILQIDIVIKYLVFSVKVQEGCRWLDCLRVHYVAGQVSMERTITGYAGI